ALKRTCENLHDALTLAEDGDTIVVAAGTYEEVLYISRDITLTGANRGISGSSHERGPETAIRGDIIIGPDAESVVIDGFAITGSITTALKARARQRFVLQNSVVDGRGARAAISLMKGASGTIADNVIMGGADEAIYVPYGFRDLVITTNCIRAATGSAAIVLGGGPGVDRVHVLGNTITGGDYGVFIEVSNGLAQPGDAIHIAGNTFGERDPCAGRPPVVACVYADDLVPAPLRASLGTSLALNSYLVSAPAVAQDVMFDEAPGDELSESGVMRVLCQGTGDSGETAANDRTDETEQPAFEPDQPRKMRAGSAE
ncbi:MAG TPA: right-handed parallel beta-helix repeat-containing protein, partial [Steroidobacteraceae bacterium]